MARHDKLLTVDDLWSLDRIGGLSLAPNGAQDDLPRIQAQSPHAYAKHMKTPTLVIHGALDYRVPDQQGLAYYNTLKARGIDARLLWFPDENHWILKPRNSRL
jgi:dipeptidyl aminopeptidase/acylaminoacyl peptidase